MRFTCSILSLILWGTASFTQVTQLPRFDNSNAGNLTGSVTSLRTATAPRDFLSVKDTDYGAKGGAREVTDAAITRGTALLISEKAAFTPADLGKTVEVTGAGAGGSQLVTTVSALLNATTVMLNATAGATVTAAALVVAPDDFEAIKRAIVAAAKSGRTLYFPQDTYYTHSGWFIDKPIAIRGNGSRLLYSIRGAWDTPEGFQIQSPTKLTFPFSAALKAGTTSIRLSSIAGLSVGQDVMLVLGTDPYDRTQPYVSQFNTIAGITGKLVALKRPIPENIIGTSHCLIAFHSFAENILIQDLIFDTPVASVNTVDVMIYLYRTRNVRISNIRMNYVSNGIAVLNSDNVSVENLHITSATGNNAAINLIGAHNFTARGVRVDNNAAPTGVRMETQNRGVSLDNISIASQTLASAVVGIQAFGHSTNVNIRNYRFKPATQDSYAVIPLQIGQESEARSDNMYLENMPAISSQDLTTHSGDLQYEGTVYHRIKTFNKVVVLTPNMKHVSIPVPDGITKGIKFLIKDKTGLTAVQALCGGSCTGDFANDLTPGLPASGVPGRLSGTNWVGVVGPQFPFNENVPPFGLTGKKIRVTTGANVPPGDFLSMEIEYYPLPEDRSGRSARVISTLLLFLAVAILAMRLGEMRFSARRRHS